jgi:flagellar FliL protein
MKKIVIIIVVLLVLVGGGGAGAYFTGALDSLLGKHETEAEAAARKAAEEKAALDAMTYVALDPLAAPIIEGRRVTRQVILTLSLQVRSLSAKNDVASIMPRLRDAMLSELYENPVIAVDGNGTIDIVGLKQRMLDVANGLVGPNKVHDVLVIKAVQTG